MDECDALRNVRTFKVIVTENGRVNIAVGKDRKYVLVSIPCERKLLLVLFPDGE